MTVSTNQWILIGLTCLGLILIAATYAIGRRLIYQALFRLLDLVIKDEIESEERQLSNRLALFLSILCLSAYSNFLFKLVTSSPIQQILEGILDSTIDLMLIVCTGATFFSLLNLTHKIYSFSPIADEVPVKGVVQVIKIAVFFLTGLFVIATILQQKIAVLLSGLGALSAVLMLIFKDSVLGFVAGLQLIANRMVSKGDWIEMPKYGADGDVVDIALTTVKVQNWDKTITTIPTYALISESFKNWRGMKESGGRRIKRTINLDLSSIKFCDQKMLDQFSKIQYIAEYIQQKQEEVDQYNLANEVDSVSLVNGRRLTNVGTFRAYAESYLRNHPDIHQGMTFLVRHRQPTEHGLPIELYVFSSDQVWANYESIQADIFDHLLSVIPEFNLRVFQAPSSSDFRSFLSNQDQL